MDNIDQMHAKQGPRFDGWRVAMIRCAGGEVPASLLARTQAR
jgi:hypothetical protein